MNSDTPDNAPQTAGLSGEASLALLRSIQLPVWVFAGGQLVFSSESADSVVLVIGRDLIESADVPVYLERQCVNATTSKRNGISEEISYYAAPPHNDITPLIGQLLRYDLPEGRVAVTLHPVPHSQPEVQPYLREAETTREEHEHQMALFAEYNPNPVLRFDSRGTILSANSNAIQAFGELSSRVKLADLLPQTSQLDLAYIINTGERLVVEHRIGLRHFDFLVRGVPELNAGHVYGTDISKRKQAEEAAQSECDKLSTMLSDIEEGVLLVDADHIAIETNSFFCRFFNIERGEIIGKDAYEVTELLAPRLLPRVKQLIEDFTRLALTEPYMIQRQYHDSEVLLRIKPIIHDNHYLGLVVNILDVTELVAARKLAESANQSKTQFLANMSHELRTPLTIINGFSEVLLEKAFGPLTEQQEHYLNQIQSSGQHLLAIISDLLDLARIESGRLELDIKDCDLGLVCREVMLMIEPRLRANVSLTHDLPEETITVQADFLRMKQVLLNLLSNAAKFTYEGHVNVCLRRTADAAELGVDDTGIGIAPEDLDRLFKPFEQVQEKTTSSTQGTGLGLALCREIVYAHHGRIEVSSTVNAGSSFRVILPATR